ncbi:MAG TPA: lysozyme, partial [Kaistia sp.]|nr:lysozyme [Kaistia sp.]
MAEITPAGLEQLVAEEGEVLRAYRDVAGVWTIGVGLTAASGVVKPKAGMVITRAESRRLLAAALARRYEPAVAAAMPGAPAHAFDGAVSFHFNTGAIAR